MLAGAIEKARVKLPAPVKNAILFALSERDETARITNPVRTVVDCFRFARLVGREAAREALRDALRQKVVTTDALFRTLEVLPSRNLKAMLNAMAP